MKLKTSIQLVEYSNLFLLFGLIIGGIAFYTKTKDGDNNAFVIEMIIGAILLISFLFRQVIIEYMIRKSKYPGIFYEVLDKLHLIKGLDLFMSDEMMDDIYKPAYTTESFLSDNNLNATMVAKKAKMPSPIIMGLIGVGIFLLTMKQPIWKSPVMIVVSIAYVIGLFLIYRNKDKQEAGQEPVMVFNENGLQVRGQQIDWKSVYDWNFEAGRKGSSGSMTINYYQEDGGIAEKAVNLETFNIDKIDFLLLLTHYRGKYQQRSDTNTSIPGA